jgi:hypothetical protein
MGEVLNEGPGRFEAVATGAMEVVGAVQGLYMGVQSLTSAFTESSSAGEFFTNFLGSLLTIIPSVITMLKLLSFAEKKNADETEKANKRKTLSEAMHAAAKVTLESIKHAASLNLPGLIAAAAAAAALVGFGVTAAVQKGASKK